MKRNMCSLIVAAVLISLVLPASAATPAGSNDPFAGTWNLNTQKSRYARGACPKRMVIVMETAGEGIRYRSETTYANGNTARAKYTAGFSGTEAIVVGSAGLLLPVSLKRLDANTVVAKYSRGLQVVATSRRVVSRDGRVMTITTTSLDPSGKSVTSTGVYERTDEVGERNSSKRKGDRDRSAEDVDGRGTGPR